MRKILIVVFVVMLVGLFSSLVLAGTNVSFNWGANHVNDGVVAYNIYRSATSGAYVDPPVVSIGTGLAPAVCPGGICAATEDNVPDGTWFWVVTAKDINGFESDYSNEVTDTLDSVAPSPPQNLTIWQKIIAWIEDGSSKMYGWLKNFIKDNPDFEVM